MTILDSLPKAGITSGVASVTTSIDNEASIFALVGKGTTNLSINCYKANATAYVSFSYPVAE